MILLLTLIREIGDFNVGHMRNEVRELAILQCLRLRGCARPPRIPLSFRWLPPDPGWYKASSSPGRLHIGGLFRNSRGFFVAAFSRPTGWGYPFEAELAACFHGIHFAAE